MKRLRSDIGPQTALSAGNRGIAALITVLLGAYRALLSPVLGQHCRFEPSCSRYAEQAIERHGAWGGGWMSLKRLLRCHPWGGAGGFDPIP